MAIAPTATSSMLNSLGKGPLHARDTKLDCACSLDFFLISQYAADVDDSESSAACSPDPVFKGDSPPQVSAGLAYLRALNQYETTQVDALVKAINAGNMSAAQQAYNRSRPLYEQVQSFGR